MFLTACNLFFYLRDAGLTNADDVVEGRFAVTEVGRRNRNFIVDRGGVPSLFVKQIPMQHPEVIDALRREAACAQLATSRTRPAPALAAASPTLLRYDPVQHVLVSVFLPGRRNLNQHLLRSGPVGPDLAAELGRVLGACHAETGRPGALLEIAAVLTGDPPWVLRVLQSPDAVMPGMNEGRRAILDLLRRQPGMAAGLEALRSTWTRSCLVHGDVKNDNVLVAGNGAPDAPMTLIDWELADLGEPAWDVAAALVSFVQPSLLGAAPAGGSAPSPAVAGAFWSAYRGAAGQLAPSSPADMARLGLLVGARLVLLAFELLPDGRPGSPLVGGVLEAARLFFADPVGETWRWFGLVPAAAVITRADPDTSRALWRAS